MYATEADFLKQWGRPFALRHADLDGDDKPDADVIQAELDAANSMIEALHGAAPAIKGLDGKGLMARLRGHACTIAAHRLAMRSGRNPCEVLDGYANAVRWLTAWRAGDLPGQTPDLDFVAGEQREADMRVEARTVADGSHRDPEESREG